ncbi:MAG TPA: hypothetical protein VLC93_06610 [Myxococcota bacterium]|nr:hypothetical protein [Myxococcota bacterium]
MTATAVSEQHAMMPLAIADGQPPAVTKPPLTLAQMQVGVDAIKTVETRAKDILDRATGPFGKNASTFWINISPIQRAAAYATIGLLAAGTYYAVGAPNPGDYVPGAFGRGRFHHVHSSSWGSDVAHAVGMAVAVGAASATSAWYAFKSFLLRHKENVRLAELGEDHIQGFVELRHAAIERPLERSVIGKLARERLVNLRGREVYFTDGVKAILETAMADEGLGDAPARELAQRHARVIDAINAVETGKDGFSPLTRELVNAIDALEPAQRDAIRADAVRRLFNGTVPRNKALAYTEAQWLRHKLSEA